MKRNDIERIIAKLPAADGNLTPQQHIGANIWLARSSSGSVQIVLSSAEPPSKTLMLRRATLDQGVNFLSEENGDIEGCVMLEFDPEVDGFAVSKVAEHLCRDGDGERSGDDLIDSVESFQSMLEGGYSNGWSWSKLIGTWGELSCLERMLTLCTDDNEILACIRSWKSIGVHCLDFVFDHYHGFAFDVKTTSRTKRDHNISSIDQVASGIYGEAYLLSIMIRPVAEGEGFTVLDLIERISMSIDGEAKSLFDKKVEALDIDRDICSAHYFRERSGRPMIMLPSSRVPGVDRFLPLPEGVPELSWPVQLTENGINGSDIDDLLVENILLQSEVISNE